jgi:hypothetical protein
MSTRVGSFTPGIWRAVIVLELHKAPVNGYRLPEAVGKKKARKVDVGDGIIDIFMTSITISSNTDSIQSEGYPFAFPTNWPRCCQVAL